MKKTNSILIINLIIISIILTALRFLTPDITNPQGNLFSYAVFICVTGVLLYLFISEKYDYFIITWLSFYFACPIILPPVIPIGSLGILNAIFLPLMVLKSFNMKNKYFTMISVLLLLGILHISAASTRIIISRIFLFLAPFIFFYFTLRKCRNTELIIWSSVIIALLNSPISIYEMLFKPTWGVELDWRGFRIFGNLFWHNSYSFFLLPAILVLYVRFRRTKERLALAGFLFLLILDIFTFSRIGIFSLFAGIIVYEWFCEKNASKVKKKRTIITTTLIVLATAYLFSYSSFDSHLKPTTIEERTAIWDTIIPYLNNNLLLGNGIGSYELYRENFLQELSSHNFYLNILFEIGIAGLIIFMTFIYFIFHDIKQKTEPDHFSSRELGLAVITAILIFSFAGNAAFTQVVSLNTWVLLGCLVKYNEKELDKKD